jgi:hypothetical protein
MEGFRKTKEQAAETVRKLLTQAEDPAATPEEAQAFTQKAQQMMSMYSIDLAMITDAAKQGEVIQKGWLVKGPYATHKVTLINAIARTNDCRALFAEAPRGEKFIDVVGYPSDVEWVETLSQSLELQLMIALAGGMREKPAGVHGRTFAVAFVQGFIAEVSKRLQRARRDAVAASERQRHRVDAPDAPSVALVLVAKSQRVEEEFKVRHPHTRSVYSQVRLRSWAGFAPGRAAGSRATLARGAVGGRRRRLSA